MDTAETAFGILADSRPRRSDLIARAAQALREESSDHGDLVDPMFMPAHLCEMHEDRSVYLHHLAVRLERLVETMIVSEATANRRSGREATVARG